MVSSMIKFRQIEPDLIYYLLIQTLTGGWGGEGTVCPFMEGELKRVWIEEREQNVLSRRVD